MTTLPPCYTSNGACHPATQVMVDISQVTTSQPLAACSIVLLENTVLVPGSGKKPNQTKTKVSLPQPPATVWVFSILLHSRAILADTTELPDAAIAHVHAPSYRGRQVPAVVS